MTDNGVYLRYKILYVSNSMYYVSLEIYVYMYMVYEFT